MKVVFEGRDFVYKPIHHDVVQGLVKKELVDSFIVSLTEPSVTHTNQCLHHFQNTLLIEDQKPEQYQIATGSMYGMIIPSTKLFYGTLAELISVVFLMKSHPIGNATFTCIGTEQNINAFRYLFQSVRNQESKEWDTWKECPNDRPGFGLIGWLEWHTNKVDAFRKSITESCGPTSTHELKKIRKWYRTHLRSTHQRK